VRWKVTARWKVFSLVNDVDAKAEVITQVSWCKERNKDTIIDRRLVFPQAWICRESEKWQFIDERHTLSSLHIHCCHLLNPAKKSPLTLFKRRSVDTGIHPGHLHRRATILNAAECSTRTIASFENETALKHTQAVISVRWTNDTINSTRKSPLNLALPQVQRKTNKQR